MSFVTFDHINASLLIKIIIFFLNSSVYWFNTMCNISVPYWLLPGIKYLILHDNSPYFHIYIIFAIN